MTINLTPEELREWAKLSKQFQLTLWSSEEEWPRWEELRDKVDGEAIALALAKVQDELAALREENERLWACVKAADALDGAAGWIYYLTESITREEGREIDKRSCEYQAARTALGEVNK